MTLKYPPRALLMNYFECNETRAHSRDKSLAQKPLEGNPLSIEHKACLIPGSPHFSCLFGLLCSHLQRKISERYAFRVKRQLAAAGRRKRRPSRFTFETARRRKRRPSSRLLERRCLQRQPASRDCLFSETVAIVAQRTNSTLFQARCFHLNRPGKVPQHLRS
jgi:hypothetical protein